MSRPISSNSSPTRPQPGVLAIYCEQVQRPREFLDAIRRCRAAGKPVILVPGPAEARQGRTGRMAG
ncbi:MAG TPA: hypothetical protein VK148_25215 [Xanthobacteraceae bacterium]|nr:hypothetical protein [Xanthobacteraceae bacterium]